MQTLIMNFTRIYEDQEFCKGPDFQWIHCEEMQGTDCYLDPDTENKLRKEISAFPLHGLHFIDSGNTHYMSKLWTDRIQEPFTLLVFDHHVIRLVLFDDLGLFPLGEGFTADDASEAAAAAELAAEAPAEDEAPAAE